MKPIEQLFKSRIFIILNLLLLLTLLFSLFIISSCFSWIPWYEDCMMQLLVIPFIVSPLLLVVGIMLFILGKTYHTAPLNKWFPFIAIGLLLFALLLTLRIAALINIVLCLLTIAITVRHFWVIKKLK